MPRIIAIEEYRFIEPDNAVLNKRVIENGKPYHVVEIVDFENCKPWVNQAIANNWFPSEHGRTKTKTVLVKVLVAGDEFDNREEKDRTSD